MGLMMDAEIKRKWVEALRSGKYRQAQRRLRRDDAFCCLGVLCDIAGRGQWRDDGGFIFEGPHDVEHTVLPVGMNDLVGLGPLDEAHLAEMNDEGESFAKIADYIEANL